MSETVVLNVTETWHKAYPGPMLAPLTMHNVLSEALAPRSTRGALSSRRR